MSETPREAAPDVELIAGIRAGDKTCLAQLAERYWPAIRRFCASFLQDEQLGEDAAQDVFARLMQPDGLPEGAARPWLYKLARNRCLDLLRRHQRSPTHDRPLKTGVDVTHSTMGPRTRSAREERQRLIARIIEQMPDEYGSVLRLKYFENLPRAEIAEVLGVTDAAVKGRLVRASEYLEEQLRKITGSAS